MTLFNLHTHTRFSDGSDEPVRYVEEAIRQGFHTIGFTDHAPVPFANTFAICDQELGEYFEAVTGLGTTNDERRTTRPASGFVIARSEATKQSPFFPSEDLSLRAKRSNHLSTEQRSNLLAILVGLEVDYIPTITKPFHYYRDNFPVDYLIGSVHLVKKDDKEQLWFIDGPEIGIYDQGLKDVFGGDARAGVTAYYRQIQEMIRDEKPDIVGHLDKIKMYNRNRYFSESDDWYVALVDETLGLIKETGCVVEVNTRGIYKKRSETLFPGPEILKQIHRLNIPVTITSDAHKPAEISNYFAETRIMLKEIGFKNQVLLTGNGWVQLPLVD
jgi:histidinol-phosphatase (PHP family)